MGSGTKADGGERIGTIQKHCVRNKKANSQTESTLNFRAVTLRMPGSASPSTSRPLLLPPARRQRAPSAPSSPTTQREDDEKEDPTITSLVGSSGTGAGTLFFPTPCLACLASLTLGLHRRDESRFFLSGPRAPQRHTCSLTVLLTAVH